MPGRPGGNAMPPSGTVTFLFTDVEGSTQRWEKYPAAMQLAFSRQEQIIREATARHNGYAYKMIGDAFQIAFAKARDALEAAIDAQRALHVAAGLASPQERNPQESPLQIRVRMALHTGVTDERGDDYVGPVLNRAARLMSAGHGGQILLSEATEILLRENLPQNVSLRDLGERRLKDLTRIEHVYEVVAPDLPSDFPPLITLDSLPNNLPLQVTSFIGREKEIEEIKAYLAPSDSPFPAGEGGRGVRLLTLTGAGGCGKTRLSLEVAADLLDAFPDGVWFIELAPLADPTLVLNTIANVLGVREEQGRPLLATLTDWLRDKQLLFVLDNCEHLIDACAKFADAVLRSSRAVRILATSREALGIAGESAYRVPSLQTPNLAEQISAEQLTHYAATELFIERAKQSLATFRVNDSNVMHIARICSRLDGIPLAIELAAARVNALSVEKIAERLDDRFRLLASGSRTALPRQQTLRALIDWSFDLLSEPERVLLRRLSVFAGGWTLEAAESVCSLQDAVGMEDNLATADRLLPTAILNLLARLVDKSLVVMDERGAETHYRMLETIRQYAHEKLEEANESERLRDEHLNFFVKLAEQAEPYLNTAQRKEWMPRLEIENDNFRAALEWACQRDPEVARWLAGLLRRFWMYGDYLNEARAWLMRVLGLGERTKTKGWAIALQGSGTISTFPYPLDEGREPIEQSITLWRELGDERRLAESVFSLTHRLIQLGQSLDACAIYEDYESLLRKSADRLDLAFILTYWGRAVANSRRDFVGANLLQEESLAVGRTLKDPNALGTTFMNMGHLATQQGEYDTARRYHLESLTWRRQLGARWQIVVSLDNVANVSCVLGDYEEAQALYQEALALSYATGDQPGVAYTKYRLGYSFVAQGKFDEAATLFADSLEILRERPVQGSIAGCLSGVAELRRAQGDTKRATLLLGFAEAFLKSNRRTFRPLDALAFDRSLTAARLQLDEATFNAAWEAGSKLTLEQAIAYAFELLSQQPIAVQTQPQTILTSVDDEKKMEERIEDALQHLHDLSYLGEHALGQLRVVAVRLKDNAAPSFINRGKALSAVLLQALQEIRPDGTEPKPQQIPPREWHRFIILNDSYVKDEPNRNIMARLYISEGTFNRARRQALKDVAKALGEMERKARRQV